MSLNKLESKKILIDFRHAKEELTVKKEMVEVMDHLFNQAVSDFLKTNPTLQKKWSDFLSQNDKTVNDILDIQKSDGPLMDTTDTMQEIDPDQITEEWAEDPEKDKEKDDTKPKMATEEEMMFKAMYREIVKKSHPDKVMHLSEEEREYRRVIYLDATHAYETKNIGELLYCAHLLKVPFEIQDAELNMLKNALFKCREESSFLEKTYTWKWYHCNENEKNALIERFIMQQVYNF